ncbi:serine/threonine protein kinase [Stieleria varia]|uniref:Serine/threonine-protein kinase PknD n=1 Tax=Stieleria varia TaxID=2528005 RepID=A0A5C6B8F6_9BACT|nr:protein kinase [Stieleria varia]TWU08047.1 Serine/threonine-protein kinase PknD [Stieleria varia]
MSIALSEFWTRLVQAGIVEVSDCKTLASKFSESHGSPPADASQLAAFLTQIRVLTGFQASHILGESAPNLRLGKFLLRGDQGTKPLSHWLPVSDVSVSLPVATILSPTHASDDETGRDGFLLRVPLDQLGDSRRQWLAAHAAIDAASLQPIRLSGDEAGNLEIFSPLPGGRCLLSLVEKSAKRIKRQQVVAIGRDLAHALAALHERSMPHGAVRLDHVWLTKSGRAILLRDPSGPALSPHQDASAAWIDCVESPGGYAAPELADPAATPTAQSDLYSLGCLLLTLISGSKPFHGNTLAEELAAQVQYTPQPLVQAVEQGEAGDPVLRVLAFALAKNPASRFASATQFADALSTADALISDKRSQATGEPAPTTAETPPPVSKAQSPASELPPEPPKKKRRRDAVVASAPSVAPPAVDSPSTVVAPPVDSHTPSVLAPSVLAPSVPAPSVPAPSVPAPSVLAPTSMPPVEPAAPLATSTAAPPIPESSVDSPAEAQPSQSAAEAARRRRRKRTNRVPVLIGLMVLPVLMLMLALFLRTRPPTKPEPYRPPSIKNVPTVASSRRDVAPPPPPKPPAQNPGGFQVVDSDQLLFVPPLPGGDQPPSSPPLALLPPGPAIILSARLSELQASDAGRELIESLAPDLQALIESAVVRTGVTDDQIERISAAFHAGTGGWPEISLAVQLRQSLPVSTLAGAWSAEPSMTGEGVTLYAGDDPKADAYYLGESDQGPSDKGSLPPDAMVRSFAVGSLDRIREVAAEQGAPILLPRTSETLWNSTSDQSHLVVLVTPNFLFADGREMLRSTVPSLVQPLKRVLIPDVAGMTLSAHAVPDQLYLEMRMLPSGGVNQGQLLGTIRNEIDSWGAWADSFVADTVPDASWRLLAARLPLMVRFVAANTRSGISDQAVVANTYLPANAAAQVSLATLLAMNTPEGVSLAAVETTTEKPLTVDEMLDRKMSISFTQESLEFAILAVVDEFRQTLPAGSTMPKARIIGSDLEKNGITQNQQIRGFEKTNMALRQVLTDIVLGANPDKTATGPQDPKQSLVWVVHPIGKPASETEILITTRDAAEGKYELPKEFVIP